MGWETRILNRHLIFPTVADNLNSTRSNRSWEGERPGRVFYRCLTYDASPMIVTWSYTHREQSSSYMKKKKNCGCKWSKENLPRDPLCTRRVCLCEIPHPSQSDPFLTHQEFEVDLSRQVRVRLSLCSPLKKKRSLRSGAGSWAREGQPTHMYSVWCKLGHMFLFHEVERRLAYRYIYIWTLENVSALELCWWLLEWREVA